MMGAYWKWLGPRYIGARRQVPDDVKRQKKLELVEELVDEEELV